MADRINFSQNINVSVQVGDTLYYTNVTGGAGNPIEIGLVTEVGSNFVEVGGEINGVIQSASTPTFATDLFFMFKKPNLNNASVKGYFAEARIATNSNVKTELFTLGSEITQSSK
tara:strand:- start:8429 stop:8773 length:345 start_codon:yes stop_codon:yes gene_type:complete